jgi:hypothetical protein
MMIKPRHLPAHLALAAFAAAMLVAAPAAHAFTYETKSYGEGGGNSIFLDPDKKVEQFGSGDVPAKPGDNNFHFYVGPSNNGFGSANDRFGPAGQFIPVPGMQTVPNNR